jgi:hypothetical protein
VPNDNAVISPHARLGWRLLQSGVPVTLLCDLLFTDGPPSREILTVEALPDDVLRSHPDAVSITSRHRSTSTG